jgi:hypothetical protein
VFLTQLVIVRPVNREEELNFKYNEDFDRLFGRTGDLTSILK